MSFEEYQCMFEALVKEGKTTQADQKESYINYTKLNWSRSKRVIKSLEKEGLNLPSKSEEYVLSPAGRSYLDEFGYSDTLKGPEANNDGGNDGPSQKSIEQPKTASQMDNTGVKSDMIIADKTSPTDVEMKDDEYSLDTKKRGRKKTIMTSVTGDTTEATLGKKTLLGG